MTQRQVLIIGGGVTGLGCGIASGLPVYEASNNPGGICASYYIPADSSERLYSAPKDEPCYRFEIGGGHWIWGGDPMVLRFLESLVSFKSYARQAAVFLPDLDVVVPYPIQNHLSVLGPTVARQVLCEISAAKSSNEHASTTMKAWFRSAFGPTLCDLFFDPFHELYTAGLWQCLAPQDESKSPVNVRAVIEGAFNHVSRSAGYNVEFLYPAEGLNAIARRMAARCNIHYEHRVIHVDISEKTVMFENGRIVPYKALLCTLPLDAVLRLANLTVSSAPDPFTSVLVFNIGAKKGPRCPTEHWIYLPSSKAGFHRVGFYSNVDSSFLPAAGGAVGDHSSIYVEKAYPGGQRPPDTEICRLTNSVIEELQSWGWIEDVQVADSTWVETAYTWVAPGSHWREEAMSVLQRHDIYQLGRYGRWAPKVTDQGITHSIRDGMLAGATFRLCA